MPILDMFMLVFLLVVAAVSIAWFVFETRSDDKK